MARFPGLGRPLLFKDPLGLLKQPGLNRGPGLPLHPRDGGYGTYGVGEEPPGLTRPVISPAKGMPAIAGVAGASGDQVQPPRRDFIQEATQAAPEPTQEIDPVTTGSTGLPDITAVEAYIREAATQRGVDPEVAVKVARSEGLAPGVWQSNFVKDGRRETSYGPFQLLEGGGLGDKFKKLYGASPSDPSTVKQQIDFALDEAATSGWGAWYGAAKVGVGKWTGLENAKALRASRGNPDGKGLARLVPEDKAGATLSASDFLVSRLVSKPASHVADMDSSMQDRLAALLQAAPDDIRDDLGIWSGARSVEHQRKLWKKALKTYGSAAKARKWVAPPGRSNHNHGKAADLSYRGQSLKHAPENVIRWLHDNASTFGLHFPLAHENWHIEMVEARGGTAPADLAQRLGAGGPPRSKARAGAPIALDSAFKPNDPMNLYTGRASPFAGQAAAALRPFRPGESIDNGDGTHSTELTATYQLDDGQWVNVPTLWMGEAGPTQFDPSDEAAVLGAMQTFEAGGGEPFARFASVEEATAAAEARSAAGGAGSPGVDVSDRMAILEATEPGRYQVVDPEDLDRWMAEWDAENRSTGIAGDTSRLMEQGILSTAQAVRELVGHIPVVGPSVVDAIDAIDEWQRGDGVTSEQHLQRSIEKSRATLTPEQAAAGEKLWVTEEDAGPSPSGNPTVRYRLGPAWTDPRSYFGGVVQSVPETAMTMVPGGLLARGAYMKAIAGGASERAAAGMAAKTATIAGAVSEGLLGGGHTAVGVRQRLAELPDEVWQGSEAIQTMMAEGMSFGDAKQVVIDDATTLGLVVGGVATGVFGGNGDRVLAKIFAEGVGGSVSRRIARGAGRGAVGEGVFEELPQEAAQQAAENLGVRTVDPNQSLLEGVPNAAAGGAVTGGAMGGGLGAAGGALSPAAEPEAPRAGPLARAIEHGERMAAGSPPRTFVVNDGPIDGMEAGALHGQTVTATPDQTGVNPNMVKVVTPDGAITVIGKDLLAPAGSEPAATSEAVALKQPEAARAPVPSSMPPVGAEVRVDAEGMPPFLGRVEAIEGDELVVFDVGTGEIYQVPADAVSPAAPVTPAAAPPAPVAQEAATVEAEPVGADEIEEAAPADPLRRSVQGKQATFPDTDHADLFDLGEKIRSHRVKAGATPGRIEKVLGSLKRRVADKLGVPVERIGEVADDYRHRIARGAKTARGEAFNAPAVNAELLRRLRVTRSNQDALARAADTDAGLTFSAEADAETQVAATWDAMEEAQRSLLLAAAGVKRSPKTAWAAFTPTIRRKLQQQGVTAGSDLEVKAGEAATSPTNTLPEPTEAQKEAGNYKKGHVRLSGLDLSIENPVGSTRSGTDKNGKAWSVTMQSHYGYIRGTKGRDKDHIDIFVRPGTADVSDDTPIHVVDQVSPETGRFDEHKVMLGWDEDTRGAVRAYNENYAKGWRGMGAITPTTIGELKEWLDSGDTTQRFAGRDSRETVQAEDSDEAVSVRLTKTPPWDFNDTYPDPDWERVRAAEAEGRSIFDDGEGGERDVLQVVSVIEEGLQHWQVNELDLAANQKAAVDLTTGRVKPKGKRTLEQEAKRLEQDTARIIQDSEDQAASHLEIWSEEAVDAMRAEARRRADVEIRQTDKGVDRPSREERDQAQAAKQKRTEPATARNDPVGQHRAAQAEADRRWPPRVETTGTGKKQQTNRYVTNEHIAFTNGAQGYAPLMAMPINVSLADIADAYEAGVAWQAQQQPAKPSPKETTRPRSPKPAAVSKPAEFAKNTIFTADKVAVARARLKTKMSQINAGIDPEMLVDGMTIAGAYIEAGIRDFADFTQRMVSDFGPEIRPFLLSFWEGARNYPGLDTQGMTTAAEAAAMLDSADGAEAAILSAAATPAAEKGDGTQELDRPGARALEGTSAEQVQGPRRGGNARKRPEGSSQPDLFGSAPARGERDDAGRGVPDGQGDVSVSAGGGRKRKPADVADARGDEGAGQQPAVNRSVDSTGSAATPAADRAADFAISADDEIGSGGQKTKYRNNVAAIRLLRQLEERSEPASRAEQAVLAKWVGWGGLRAAFPREDGSTAKGWDKESAELRALLTPAEYRAAESSTRNAHYTAIEVVKAIWSAVERLGFKGGQVLEPSVGAGNFLGAMPGGLRKGALVTGVELDNITGGIAKHLYPRARVLAPKAFQDVTIPDDHFDLAIGNPPFGSERVYDPERRALNKFSIHNYFFAKAIDTLKPNGVLAMVVTNLFLDAGKDSARAYIAERADLIAAIRLPNTAFLANAGTEVTTDIIFLRKRRQGETHAGPKWSETREFTGKDGKAVPLNEYFVANPDMMLGDFGAYGTMYGRGDQGALIARDGDDLPALLAAAIAKLPADIMDPPGAPVHQEEVKVPDTVGDALVGSLFLAPEGEIFIRRPDLVGQAQAERVEFPSDKAKDRVAGMIRVRDAFARLRRSQLDETAPDSQIENLRALLNKAYDTFVRKNGPINADANKRLFRDDPTWPQIAALESNYDRGVSDAVAKNTGEASRAPSAEKAAIFTKRTQHPYRRPTKATSAKDALAQTLADVGRVDLAAMSALYGRSPGEIVEELGALLFLTPDGSYETADAYLSGNVKRKLAEARRAAERDPAFARNVTALQDVIPADIEPVDIDVKAGAPWIPADDTATFIDHVLESRGAKATYSPVTAKWLIRPTTASAAAAIAYGTDRVSPSEAIEAALNGRAITVYDKLSDGKTVLNQQETEAAQEKVEKVRAEWKRWVWQDDDRRARLAALYNDTFNTDVQRAYDGAHLTLPGKVGEDIVSLRPHQKNFIWRTLQSSTALADHVVGAGKTFALIASIMEKRRMGQARKPMLVVPNHLVGQWGADFVKLYPGARVLAATKKDFDAENRKKLFARIATGDWDAVIVAHSSFGRIGVSPEFETAFIQQQLADIEAATKQLLAEDGKKSRAVNQLAKWRENMEAKLKKLLDAGAKDDGLTFEELGIDALYVDEAHEFKNLAFATSMYRVLGLGNPTGSQKAADLFIKIQSILERTGGRNVVFATGTPLSNTMAEMFTVQRYLDGDALRELGIAHFDAWAKVFGEVVTDWELSASGQYKMVSRFAKFVNLPELMQRYLSFADVISNDDIKAMLAKQGKKLPLPKVKGGKPESVVVERSPDQAEYIGIGKPDERGNLVFPHGSLVWRSENLPKGKPQPGDDNMLKVMSDARKAALDMRLIDPSYGDHPGSKVHAAADRIKSIYDRWSPKLGTQLVFIDLSTPKKALAREKARILDLAKRAEEGDEAAQQTLDKMSPDEFLAIEGGDFSVYDDLRDKLIARGVPAREIAFIHDANTDIQKEELFAKVRSGRIRILFGSTAKMGAGTNVQNRLVALHHMDAPWRPSDLEQRDGRAVRQGNELYAEDPEGFEIEILRYATKATLDARQWQTIEGKARFIGQVRKGATKQRQVEDIVGEAANAAEMKAAASGNPLILEEMDLRNRVRRLNNLSSEHDREQYRIRDRIRSLKREADDKRKQLPAYGIDAEKAKDAMPDRPFAATIDGRKVTKPSEMGAALIAIARRLLDEGVDGEDAGTYSGFDLRVDVDRKSGGGLVTIAGERETWVEMAAPDDAEPVGTAMRVINAVRRRAAEPREIEGRIAEIERQIPALERQIGEFGAAKELADVTARHRDVLDQLKPKQPGTVTTPPKDAQASIEEDGPRRPIFLTGKELGVPFTSDRDMPSLWRAARTWYDTNLRPVSATMVDGTRVVFSRKGMGKVTSAPKGDLLLRAVPSIREIIERGRIVFREPGNRPGVAERIIIAHPVQLDSIRMDLAVSVHRTEKGAYHYDLGVERPGSSEPLTHGGLPDGGELPSLDTPQADPGTLNLFLWGVAGNHAPSGWETVGDLADVVVLTAEDRKAIAGIVRQVSGLESVTWADHIELPDGAADWGTETPSTAGGIYSPSRDLIAIALDIGTRRTAYHEAFHRLQNLFLTDDQKKVLADDRARLRRIVASNPFRRHQVARMSQTELEAEAFAMWAEQQDRLPVKPHTALRAAWQKIADVIRRVRAWLVDSGFIASADPLMDIFDKARRGEIRQQEQRPPSLRGQGTNIELSRKPGTGDALPSLSEQRVVQEVRGKLVDLQPHLLKTIPFNYFTELARPGMTAVGEYLRVKRLLDAYRGKKHAEMDVVAQNWLKFSRLGRDKAKALADLMHEATLAGVDPTKTDSESRAHPSYAVLKAKLAALPPNGRELFARVRDAYKAQAAELDKILLDNVRKAHEIAQKRAEAAFRAEIEKIERSKVSAQAKKDALKVAEADYKAMSAKAGYSMKARLYRLRMAFEASRVAEPYFPLARFGRYFVSVRDVDGTIQSFSRRESAADRDRLVAELRAAFPAARVETGVIESAGEMRSAMDPRIVAEMEEIIGGAGLDPDTASAVLDQMWQRYLAMMPDLSTRKRFIHRKGTAGFEGDALRAFASHMFHSAHQMGRLKYGLELQELTNEAADQARKSDDPTYAMTLANELKGRHKWVMNPTGSSVAQVMTSGAFLWYLATSPAAAIINMSQTVVLGLPVLAGRFGSFSRAAAALVKASSDSVAGRGSVGRANLTEDERRALEHFYESGLIDRTQSHDIAGVGETGVEYSPVRARVMAVMSWMFHRAEVWNREVTALAAYRMARAAGQNETQAIDTAHDLTWRSHFDYSNSSRPTALQSDTAKVLFVFRAHNINMLYRLFRDIQQSFKGETPQARSEARRQLAGVMGMMALHAGVKGVPFFSLAMILAGMIFGDEDDPLDFQTRFEADMIDILGPELGGLVLNGAPGHYLGVDLTARLGMPDLWFRSPSRDLEGRDEFEYWVINSLGASVGMLGDWFHGVQLLREGNVVRGVEAVSPKWARDLMRAWRHSQEGVTNLKGDQLIAASQITAWDTLAQSLGFTPAKIAEMYDRASALENAEAKVTRKRSRLINAYAMAARMSDPDAKRDAIDAIKRFNGMPAHRGVKITPDTLKRSLKTRDRNARKREDGALIADKELGRYLREAMPERLY